MIPGLGRCLGEGNGNPLQYSCLENPTDGGAWWATVHGVAKSWIRLSDLTFTFFNCHLSPKGTIELPGGLLVKNVPAMQEMQETCRRRAGD